MKRVDRILWNRDYKRGSQFLDLRPEKCAAMKQMLGIDGDYHSTISPNAISDDAAARILQRIENLGSP